jgi:outer membrane murein-binding lipoprotein Lpp
MLKKWFLVGAMLLLSVLLVVGCGVAQEDLDAAVAERDAAKAQVTSLQSDLTAAESDLAAAQSDLAAAQSDLTATESDLTAAEGKVSSLQSQVSSLSSDLATAEARIAELEAAEEPPPPPPEEEEEEEEPPAPPPADGECDGIAAADVTNAMAGDTITVYGMVTGNETEMFSNDGMLLIDDIAASEFAIHIKPDDVDKYPALEDYVGKMVCVTGVAETHGYYSTPGLRLSDDPADIVVME